METTIRSSPNGEKVSFSDTIIKGLKKAATELEEFRLQSALGKAEAKDAFEVAKKMFNKYVHETKIRIDDARNISKERYTQLKTALETLQVQLALGKAETKEAFEHQRKKIVLALNALEMVLRKNKTSDKYYAKLQIEVKKFNIKLDILKLRFELNKLGVRSDFDHKKIDFSDKLVNIKKRLLKKEKEIENRWEYFNNEITVAYSHLKRAFVK